MIRTALFALLLALGGSHSFGGAVNVISIWAADEVDAGNIWDPFGGGGASQTSGAVGSGAESDAGAIWDPFG
jgi:hypothetical protein